MTTANKITIFRVLLVPFFIVQVIYYSRTGDEWYRLAAILAFSFAAISDGVDGYIARRYNQRSELGAMLDPLADKLLLVSAIVLLSRDHNPFFQRIPLWVTAIILSRDIILLIGLCLIYYIFGKVVVRPRLTGKLATVLQMAMIFCTLLQWREGLRPYLIAGAAIFTAASGALYIWDGTRQLSTSPASGAVTKASQESKGPAIEL